MSTTVAPQRSIFYGFGAWVGSQRGATTCRWWPDDPNEPSINWDRNKLIYVDLSRGPSAVQSNRIRRDEIEVDDHGVTGGLTRIGPTWPTGSMINSIWLESRFWDQLPQHNKPSRVPRGFDGHDYELTSVLYWSGNVPGRRYYGFHAEITAPVRGTMALCTVYQAGQSRQRRAEGTWWLDLAQVAHPIAAGFTGIGIGPNEPKQGALFLDAITVTNLRLAQPKIPPFLGHHLFPAP
jgi:hypothetical protein